MFDLEKVIEAWRSELIADGVSAPEVLDELESHLREDIDQQVCSGIGVEQAFRVAVERIGQGVLLKKEFAKTGRAEMSRRTISMLKLVVFAGLLLTALAWVNGFYATTPTAGKLVGISAIAFILIFTGRHLLRHIDGSFESYPLAPDTSAALEVARQEASRYQHDFVGTEHLLLGILDKGLVPGILRASGLQAEAVRKEVEHLVGAGSGPRPVTRLPYTPRATRALRLASAEAKRMRQNHVAPECLLLGLLLEGQGVAALALKNLQLDFQWTRDRITGTKQNQG